MGAVHSNDVNLDTKRRSRNLNKRRVGSIQRSVGDACCSPFNQTPTTLHDEELILFSVSSARDCRCCRCGARSLSHGRGQGPSPRKRKALEWKQPWRPPSSPPAVHSEAFLRKPPSPPLPPLARLFLPPLQVPRPLLGPGDDPSTRKGYIETIIPGRLEQIPSTGDFFGPPHGVVDLNPPPSGRHRELKSAVPAR